MGQYSLDYMTGALGRHGFLLSKDGAFTTIDASSLGAVGTIPTGINSKGDVVGEYWKYDRPGDSRTLFPHGFLLTSDGVFTTIDVPGGSFTRPTAINPQGDIVGSYYILQTVHGFLLSNGVFTTIDVPGASFTQVAGITPQGDLVGYCQVPGRGFSFLWSKPVVE